MESTVGITALHLAALWDQIASAESLIHHGASINKKIEGGRTSLHLAALKGHIRIIECLIEHGVDINEEDSIGQTALHSTAQVDQVAAMQYLITRGAEVNKVNRHNGMTALHVAVSFGHFDASRCLIDHGAEVNNKSEKIVTPLHLAAMNGHADITEYLINRGAMVNGEDEEGLTALTFAAQKGHTHVIECLIKNGAEINRKVNDGSTALHLAANSGDLPVTECLVKYGAEVNIVTNDGFTPLHLSAIKGYVPVTEYLIKHGSDVERSDVSGTNALHFAAISGHVGVTECLIKHGADVNRETGSGLTAVHQAAIAGHVSVIECLINHGAEVNKKAYGGVTALHLAALYGHDAVAVYLINHRAEVNIKGEDGASALHLAAMKGSVPVIECLVNHGAELKSEVRNSTTPLHVAARHNCLTVIEFLISLLISQSYGAKSVDEGAKPLIDQPDEDGFTTLHIATEHGCTAIIETLVIHGADMNIQSYRGETCLHQAIKMVLSKKVEPTAALRQISAGYPHYDLSNEQALVLFLLDHGADPYIYDQYMKTPIDYVQDRMFYQVISERIQRLKHSTEKSQEQSTRGEPVSSQKLSDFWILMCFSSVLIDHLCRQLGNQPLDDMQGGGYHSSTTAERNKEDVNAVSVLSNRDYRRLRIEDSPTPVSFQDFCKFWSLMCLRFIVYDPRRTKGRIDERGGELHIPSYGFTLSIPPGALEEGTSEEITLEVLTDIPNNIDLQDDEITVSHGFQCYPSGLHFREPLTLVIPHCAVFDHASKVETALYTWDALGQGTPVRYPHTAIDCMVSETHFILAVDHFSGGFLAFIRKFLKGKLVSCMPYLPKTMPASLEPVLEVRFVNKPKGMKWRDVHEYDPLDQSSRTRPATDRDREVFVKQRNLEVTCQMTNHLPESKNVEYKYFMRKNNHTVDFILDFHSCKTYECNITLTLAQKSLLEEIIFTTWFADYRTEERMQISGFSETAHEFQKSDGNDHSRKQDNQVSLDISMPSEPTDSNPSHQVIPINMDNTKYPGARPKTQEAGDPPASSPPVSGIQVTQTHADSQRKREANDGDKGHQNAVQTIKITKKDPGTRPKIRKDGTGRSTSLGEGTCIQSHPGPSQRASPLISMVPSSEDEFSSASTNLLTVPHVSSTISESKTSSTQNDKGLEEGDESGTADCANKKKKSRGARGRKKNKKKKDRSVPLPPPPPEIIDEIETKSSELDQMKQGDIAVAEEQIGAMAQEDLASRFLQGKIQGRIQESTTNVAIFVNKVLINQSPGISSDSTIAAMPTIVPTKLRHKLGVKLNRKSAIYDDWKGLASHFDLGEFIDPLEQKPNPTEELIRLIEKRKKIQSLDDLASAFRLMKREDCEELCQSYALDQGRTCTQDMPDQTIDEDSDSF